MASGYSVKFPSIESQGLNKYSGGLSRGADYHAREKRAKLSQIANISDDEIILSSIKYADKKAEESMPAKVLKAITPLFAIIVPAVYGAMQKGTIIKDAGKIVKSNVLSTKVGTAVVTAGVFAGANALLNGFDGLMDRIDNSSNKVSDFRKEHQLASFVGDFALQGLMLAGATFGIYKGKNYLANKFQPTAHKLSKSIAQAADKLDSTKLASKVTKLSDKVSTFGQKHPKISSFVDKNSFLIPIVGWMGLTFGLNQKVDKNREQIAAETASKLLNIREIARDSIANS